MRGNAPTHGQPAGSDFKSIQSTQPITNEAWKCGVWVQNSPDDIPELSLDSHFVAVTAGNIDDDETNEILVSAIKGEHGWLVSFDGYLLTYEILDEIDAFFGMYSLRVADLDGDEALEICSTGYRSPGSDDGLLWQAYIFVWDYDGNQHQWVAWEDVLLNWDTAVNLYPYVYLDAGEIDADNLGDEIVISSPCPFSSNYQIVLYSYYNRDTISFIEMQARIYNVEVGNCNDNEQNEIIAAGSAKLNACPVFYLEVFDANLSSLWKRVGEHRREGRVFDTAVVK